MFHYFSVDGWIFQTLHYPRSLQLFVSTVHAHNYVPATIAFTNVIALYKTMSTQCWKTTIAELSPHSSLRFRYAETVSTTVHISVSWIWQIVHDRFPFKIKVQSGYPSESNKFTTLSVPYCTTVLILQLAQDFSFRTVHDFPNVCFTRKRPPFRSIVWRVWKCGQPSLLMFYITPKSVYRSHAWHFSSFPLRSSDFETGVPLQSDTKKLAKNQRH